MSAGCEDHCTRQTMESVAGTMYLSSTLVEVLVRSPRYMCRHVVARGQVCCYNITASLETNWRDALEGYTLYTFNTPPHFVV